MKKKLLKLELNQEYKEKLLKIDSGKFKKFSNVKQLKMELEPCEFLQHHNTIYKR